MSRLSSLQLQAIEEIFDGISLGIVATDLQGIISFYNPAAATLIGIDGTAIYTDDWPGHYGIYLPDKITLCPSTESPLAKALAGEEADNYELFIQNQLGRGRSRWCAIDYRPLKKTDGEITGALLLMQDTSKRKKLSDEVARSNLALQQFATVAAHDLQEPLRSISGFTDMLAQHQLEQLDDKSKRCMSKIKDGVLRMQTLISDLLLFSRIQTNPQILKPSDCNAIVATCIKSLNASIIKTGATITVDPLPIVQADASQLAQLFQNLIGNALKFCSADRPPEVRVSAKRHATAWQFSVEDNGIGIAPEFAERVFRIFQRLHTASAYPGTGIGLAICQTIVERHEGKLWVESVSGKGATFCFTIPEIEKA